MPKGSVVQLVSPGQQVAAAYAEMQHGVGLTHAGTQQATRIMLRGPAALLRPTRR